MGTNCRHVHYQHCISWLCRFFYHQYQVLGTRSFGWHTSSCLYFSVTDVQSKKNKKICLTINNNTYPLIPHFVHHILHRKFQGSLSTNVAMAASVILASRLKDNDQVFSLLLLAVELFGLFPIFRRFTRVSWIKKLIIQTFSSCFVRLAFMFYSVFMDLDLWFVRLIYLYIWL